MIGPVLLAAAMAGLAWTCRNWWPWEAQVWAWTPTGLLLVGLLVRGVHRRAAWRPAIPAAPAVVPPEPRTPTRATAQASMPVAAVVDLQVEREHRRAA